MKHSLIAAFVAVALSGIVLAETKETARPNADTEKAVQKLEDEMVAAITKPDAAAVERLVADGYFFVSPDGGTSTKAQFVGDVKSGDLKIESTKYAEMKVQVADADMAIVTYRSTDKGTYKGKDISGDYRWIDVLVKRDGRWQFMVGQGTRIAETKP
jgi:hypothetical protein